MKKIIILLISLTQIIGLCSCTNTVNKSSKLKITTTIFPYYSFSNEIFGEDAEISMLIKPGSESHTYDPTPQDILKIQNSDVFIYTGGESDKWVETVISSIDTSKTKIINAKDYIELNNKHEDHNHNEIYDEHIWTSVKNSIMITETIYNAVGDTKYQEKKDEFINKLSQLDKEFEEISINNPDKTLIFADRFPFSYFVDSYNFSYISAFPSCSEESEPSIQKMSEIIKTIKNENTKIVFYIEFSNQKIADTIQRETNVKKLLFHSCHNITTEEFEAGVSYYNLMEQNLNNLKEAVK